METRLRALVAGAGKPEELVPLLLDVTDVEARALLDGARSPSSGESLLLSSWLKVPLAVVRGRVDPSAPDERRSRHSGAITRRKGDYPPKTLWIPAATI